MAIEVARPAGSEVRRQYERWPYPAVPLVASVPSTHPWQLHVDWIRDRCGSPPAPARPRIWIAGCGTFQPYVFAQANPHAEILATDLSRRSLEIARRRCALRGLRRIGFRAVDLTRQEDLPEGPFDFIECYGVLMNLPDPAAALAALADRLAPGGVLRVMVYPWFSRQRIFQVQRLARLLGLHAGDRRHPRRLRSVMRRLPRDHPLRHAFSTYPDSRNDAGVVDAFLHAGDRGFTGFQLGELVRGAGLRPAMFFHRPWGQPDRMASRLGMQDRGWEFVLNYLDLWQELRGNFVLCLVRDGGETTVDAGADPAPPAGDEPAPHPLLGGRHGGLRHRLRLLQGRLFGATLPDRLGTGPLRLSAADFRALAKGASGAQAERLRQAGLILEGCPAVKGPAPASGERFAGEARFLAPRLELGRRAANPLYRHLFQAWSLAALHPELGLLDLETQIGRWLPHADPLEDEGIRFGLTPYGTYLRFRANVQEWLQRLPDSTRADTWDDVRLRHDDEALATVSHWLERRSFRRDDPPGAGELRELWCLLFSHRELFLPLMPAVRQSGRAPEEEARPALGTDPVLSPRR